MSGFIGNFFRGETTRRALIFFAQSSLALSYNPIIKIQMLYVVKQYLHQFKLKPSKKPRDLMVCH